MKKIAKPKVAKKKKLVPQLDVMDLEAEKEGQSIKRSSEVRVKRTGKKPKINPVNARMMDDEFDARYGYGYEARKADDEK